MWHGWWSSGSKRLLSGSGDSCRQAGKNHNITSQKKWLGWKNVSDNVLKVVFVHFSDCIIKVRACMKARSEFNALTNNYEIHFGQLFKAKHNSFYVFKHLIQLSLLYSTYSLIGWCKKNERLARHVRACSISAEMTVSIDNTYIFWYDTKWN